MQSFIGRAWFLMGARRVSVLKTEVSLLVEVLKVHFKICTNPTEIVGGWGVSFQNDFHFGVAAGGRKLRPAISLVLQPLERCDSMTC